MNSVFLALILSQQPCPECHGLGKRTVTFQAKCEKCHGTGKLETKEPPVTPGPPPKPIVQPGGFVPYHAIPRRPIRGAISKVWSHLRCCR